MVCIDNQISANRVYEKLISKGMDSSKIKHISNYLYSHCLFNNLTLADCVSLWQDSDFSNQAFKDRVKSQKDTSEIFSDFYFEAKKNYRLHNDLEIQEEELLQYYNTQSSPYPMVGVSMSRGRIGSTLMTQWLASSGLVEYPTNLFDAYRNTPLCALLHQKLLRLPGHRLSKKEAFTSDYKSYFGDTNDLFEPYEYSISCSVLGDIVNTKRVSKLQIDKSWLMRIRQTREGLLNIAKKPFVAKISIGELVLYNQIGIDFEHFFIIFRKRYLYTHYGISRLL